MKSNKQRGVLAGAVTVGLAAAAASAAPITAGDLVVYRVGDGTQTLANTGNSVFLDEYTPAGATPVQSIAAPTASTGATNALIASGTATSEGLLSISPNGQSIALTGYDAALGGTTSLTSSAAATTPRTVGILSVATGTLNTSTALTDLATGNNPRSAAYDGTNIFADGGAGGVRATTVGATTSTQLSTTTVNLRQLNVFAGQLFVSSSSGATRLATVGTGSPTTTGQTITNLPGITTTNSGSPYAFYLADLSPTLGFGTTGLDTLYVADSTNGIQKFGFDGTNFVAEGTVADANVTGLTASVTAGVVSLYATTATSLQLLTDATGEGGTLAGTPTTLATAPTGTAFRGVALVPNAATGVPEPTTLAAAAAGAAGPPARRRRHA